MQKLGQSLSKKRQIILNSKPSATTFYLCAGQWNNELRHDSFKFKFGITINPNERLASHKSIWRAVYKNTIFVTSSDPNFSTSFEKYLKENDRTEFRMGINNYDRICEELLDISKSHEELNLKFYIHSNYNLPSHIGFFSKYYFDQFFFNETTINQSESIPFLSNLVYLKKTNNFSTLNI